MSHVENQVASIDAIINENLTLVSSRNIEYIEKLLDVKHKINGDYYHTDEHKGVATSNTTSEKVVEYSNTSKDNMEKALYSVNKYKEHKKKHLKDMKQEDHDMFIKELGCFVDELFGIFKEISTTSVGNEDERKIVRLKIKEIYSLFN